MFCVPDKKVSGKSKDEQMAEKKQELEKRLQDVSGALGHQKKAMKKGTADICLFPQILLPFVTLSPKFFFSLYFRRQ